MLDKTIQERAWRLVQTQFEQRKVLLPKEITQIKRKMQLRGMSNSSVELNQIHTACVKEVAERAKIVRDSILRAHQAMGSPLTKTLAEDIKREFNHFINNIVSEISRVMTDAMKFMERDSRRYNLEDIKVNAINETSVEVDLYVDSLIHKSGEKIRIIGEKQEAPNKVTIVDPQELLQNLDSILDDLRQLEAQRQHNTYVDKYIRTMLATSYYSTKKAVENILAHHPEITQAPPDSNNPEEYLKNAHTWCVGLHFWKDGEQIGVFSEQKQTRKIVGDGGKKEKTEQEGTLEPKPPEFLQKLLWIIKYGRKNLKIITLAVIILLVYIYYKVEIRNNSKPSHVNSVDNSTQKEIDGYIVTKSGTIIDKKTGLEWNMDLNRTVTWNEAVEWVKAISSNDGDWRMPTVKEIATLYNPNYRAGHGFYKEGKYFPPHIHPVFDKIGEGAWLWSSESVDDNYAYAYNLNQNVPVKILKDNRYYTTQVFAVRKRN